MVEIISVNNALVVANTIKTDMILINRKTTLFLLSLQVKIEEKNVSLRSTHFELTNWNLWVFNPCMMCLSHPPSRSLSNENWICEFAVHVIWNYLRPRTRTVTRTRIHEDLQKPVRTFYVFGVVQRPARTYKGPRGRACVILAFPNKNISKHRLCLVLPF